MMIRKAVQTAALVLGTLTVPVSATTIEFLGNDPSMGMDITIKADGQEVTWFSGFTNLIYDGLLHQTAFCVDAFTEIWNGSHSVIVEDPSNLTGGMRMAWLMQNMLNTVTTPVQAAAMQLAIWDIAHDGGNGFAAGRIQSIDNLTDAAVVSAAQSFLTASVDQASNNATVYSNIAGRDMAQTLITCGGSGNTCGGGGGEVPEPGTLAMLAIGLATTAFGLRRRQA